MVHSAVENQEFLSTRFLDIDDASYVNARLSYKEPARFDNKTSTPKLRISAYLVHQDSCCLRQAAQVQVVLAGKIRNTQSSTKIDCVKRSADLGNDGARNLDTFSKLVYEHRAVQDLCSHKHVDAAEVETGS